MSAGKYDPFAVEKPVLKLGQHGSWTLGDITESRAKKLDELIERAKNLDPDSGIAGAAAIIGELCEAACINSAGLKDLVVDLCDESKHGEDALGLNALAGVSGFVAEWFTSEVSVGEG